MLIKWHLKHDVCDPVLRFEERKIPGGIFDLIFCEEIVFSHISARYEVPDV